MDPNSLPTRYIGSCRERNLCCSGRDSSCSVPVPSINTNHHHSAYHISSLLKNPPVSSGASLIGNLLGAATDGYIGDVKECYCDSACITLGDCCADYKETCGVQDCIVSEWDQWSECNTTCGVGSMTRSRHIISHPKNGGKDCPDLNQRRACHGQHCKIKDDEKMLREMAIILQSNFSVTRNVDEDKDIRRNLRLNYPKDPLKENVNEYCVLFEVTKSHKSCESLNADVFSKLQEGSNVCVHCQDAAMRSHLGYRCYGHGTKGRSTRWSLFNFSGCHGRWTRMEEQLVVDGQCSCQHKIQDALNGTIITMNINPDFIFV